MTLSIISSGSLPLVTYTLSIQRKCTACSGEGEILNILGLTALHNHEPVAVEDVSACPMCKGKGWVPVDDMRVVVTSEVEGGYGFVS